MSNTPRFLQARLKHERARNHIHDLRTQWDGYLQTDFCRVLLDDRFANKQTIQVVSTGPLPSKMLLTIGDAVHNLRCALDYTVNEILDGQNTRITFPMDEERENLKDSFRTAPVTVDGRTKGKGRNAAIEEAVPGIGMFIVDELRPYKGHHGYLWPLGKLDNTDKHRLLVPVLVPQTVKITNVRGHNFFFGAMTVTVGAGGYCNLLEVAPGAIRFDCREKPTAELFFDEAGIVQNERVFTALDQMSEAVLRTITSLDDFLSTRKI